ncbi:MAG: hypothetical protein M1319_04940, partial [Chloroflexi bacterium]|nr:hypothetical protein [Chloroflexota bacterium]
LHASVLLSIGFTARMSSTWDEHLDKYQAIGQWFEDKGLASQTVMIVDPPGYYYATGQRSIVLSNDPVETDIALAAKYGAKYLVLEEARPDALTALYEEQSYPDLLL